MQNFYGLMPHIDLGWQHGFNTLRPRQVLSLRSLTQSFTVLGAPLTSDAATARFGFIVPVWEQVVLSFDYDGSFANRTQNNAIRGGIRWEFET